MIRRETQGGEAQGEEIQGEDMQGGGMQGRHDRGRGRLGNAGDAVDAHRAGDGHGEGVHPLWRELKCQEGGAVLYFNMYSGVLSAVRPGAPAPVRGGILAGVCGWGAEQAWRGFLGGGLIMCMW